MQYFHIPRTFIASEGIHLENLNLEYSSMLNYGISQMLEDHIDKVLVSAYDYVRYDSSFRRVLSLQRLRETILYMQKHNREAYCLRSGKDEVLTYDLLATRLLGEKHAEDLEAVFGRIAPMFETVDFTEKKWLDPSHRPPGVSYIWKDIDVEAYQEAQDSDEEYDREKWLKIGMLVSAPPPDKDLQCCTNNFSRSFGGMVRKRQ